ncbi:unnamed protein product [Peniophora sp. CBMAI 1063]|nr:unnamed protein product [Peniophora sp. CBMAI 1063]
MLLFAKSVLMIISFDAIVDTYLLKGALAIRLNSEVAALRHWQQVLSTGNEVAWLGSASIEEVSAFMLLCTFLLMRMQRLAFREVLCDRLHAQGSVLQASDVANTSTGICTSAQASLRRNVNSPRSSLDTPSAPPQSPRPTPQSPSTFSSPGFPDPHDARLAAAGVVSYAPPPRAGVGYRPSNLPADYECRGDRSNHAWYVAWKSRRPGIYCNWDHVEAAHGNCGRKRLAEGHMTYAAAIQQWVKLRDADEIKRWA